MRKRLQDWSQKKGIGIEDEMIFYPVQGKRKVIPMRRTEYFINASKQSYFPLWGQEVGGVRITWREVYSDDRRGVYTVEAITEPFLYNGNYVWKAILCHGDEISLGYNRLRFIRKQVDDHALVLKKDYCMEKENLYRSSLNIVIEGETGTGKSYLAKKIHEVSKRNGRFVHINLASFSKNLIESELFGHIEGAYTGAVRDKRGAILEANQGTLFLDEIDSLPLDLQLKLLLFLDNKKVRPVGGMKDRKVDVRLIFASGQSLKSCVQQGSMRKDFYYRINAGHKEYLKPLRLTPDILRSFCEKYLENLGYFISGKLLEFYEKYSWPGNIRQLKAHLDKKIIFSKGQKIIFDKWDSDLVSSGLDREMSEVFEYNELTFSELKTSYFLRTYYQLGSYQAASKKLGIAERTLRKFLDNLSYKKESRYKVHH